MGRLGSRLPRVVLTNRALGRPPTAVGWDTPPSNLERAVDGDWDTATGTGSTTLGAAGNLGMLEFDLGEVYNIMLVMKLGLWVDTSYIRVFVDHSPDGVTWITSPIMISGTGATSESIQYNSMFFLRARYFRVRFYGYAAMTGYVKVYEIQAYELP